MSEGPLSPTPSRIDRAALERIIRRAAELQTTERGGAPSTPPPSRLDRAALEGIIRPAAELKTTGRGGGETPPSDELISGGRGVGIPARSLQQAPLGGRPPWAPPRAPGLMDRIAGP